jgi:hypothetical protein
MRKNRFQLSACQRFEIGLRHGLEVRSKIDQWSRKVATKLEPLPESLKCIIRLPFSHRKLVADFRVAEFPSNPQEEPAISRVTTVHLSLLDVGGQYPGRRRASDRSIRSVCPRRIWMGCLSRSCRWTADAKRS